MARTYHLLDEEYEVDPEAGLPPIPEAPAEPGAAPTTAPVDGLARLAELVAARGEQPGQYDQERAFIEGNKPQAGWKNVLGAIGAALAESAGSSGAIDSFHKRGAEARKAYEAGLENARGIDLGKRNVDQGTAEMLVLGGMTPEAAAEVTQGSPSLTLAKSGMGQLGARYKAMDQQAAQKEAALAAKEKALEDAQQHAKDLETQRQGGRIELKKTIPGKAPGSGGGGGGAGGGMPPEQLQRNMAYYLAQQANTSDDEALAFTQGKTDGLDPAKLSSLQRHQGIFAMLPQKAKVDILKDTVKREASRPDKLADAIELKKRDPNKRVEYKREIDQSHRAISEARAAWSAMSEADKKVLAQFSGESWASGAIRDASLSAQGQAQVGAIQALANRLIKEASGAAVSDSEWTRIAREMGLAGRNYDMLKGPEGIQRWLDSALGAWVRNKRVVESEFTDLFPKKGAPGG
jgi:hypothetical protein